MQAGKKGKTENNAHWLMVKKVTLERAGVKSRHLTSKNTFYIKDIKLKGPQEEKERRQ